jgi:hypothetical protein
MYVYCYVYVLLLLLCSVHRANWHPSATLTDVSPTQLQLTNISTYQHTTLNTKQTTPVFLYTLTFNRCPKTAPIRRSMKLISIRKLKSKRRQTCPEIFWYWIYGLYYVKKVWILRWNINKLRDSRSIRRAWKLGSLTWKQFHSVNSNSIRLPVVYSNL